MFVAQALRDGGFFTADSQPLPREFVSEVSIKMFEDELSDATSLSFVVSQTKDTMQDHIVCHLETIKDWSRKRASLDYFASKIEFLQKPEVNPKDDERRLSPQGWSKDCTKFVQASISTWQDAERTHSHPLCLVQILEKKRI